MAGVNLLAQMRALRMAEERVAQNLERFDHTVA